MSDALPQGATIGILGGGQLGRMLSVAAARLGYRCHVYDPGTNPPAGDVCAQVTSAPWEDEAALRAFAASVDVITFEFENVPTATLDLLEAARPIRPDRRALAVSQDRLTEKQFLRDLGLTTAPFAPVSDADTLEQAVAQIGTPAILKTRRFVARRPRRLAKRSKKFPNIRVSDQTTNRMPIKLAIRLQRTP